MLQREAEQIDEAKTPGNRGEFQMRFPVNPVNIWQRWKPHHLVRCPLMKHRCIVNLMKQSEATRNGDPKLSPRKCWTAGFGRRCLSLRRTGFWKWPHFGHIWAVQFMFTFFFDFFPGIVLGPSDWSPDHWKSTTRFGSRPVCIAPVWSSSHAAEISTKRWLPWRSTVLNPGVSGVSDSDRLWGQTPLSTAIHNKH